jgi:hypothetical protein
MLEEPLPLVEVIQTFTWSAGSSEVPNATKLQMMCDISDLVSAHDGVWDDSEICSILSYLDEVAELFVSVTHFVSFRRQCRHAEKVRPDPKFAERMEEIVRETLKTADMGNYSFGLMRVTGLLRTVPLDWICSEWSVGPIVGLAASVPVMFRQLTQMLDGDRHAYFRNSIEEIPELEPVLGTAMPQGRRDISKVILQSEWLMFALQHVIQKIDSYAEMRVAVQNTIMRSGFTVSEAVVLVNSVGPQYESSKRIVLTILESHDVLPPTTESALYKAKVRKNIIRASQPKPDEAAKLLKDLQQDHRHPLFTMLPILMKRDFDQVYLKLSESLLEDEAASGD